jgi:hypothetical protein
MGDSMMGNGPIDMRLLLLASLLLALAPPFAAGSKAAHGKPGPMPQSCPASRAEEKFSESFPIGAGPPPLWAVLWAPTTQLHIRASDKYTHGYGHKLMWVIDPTGPEEGLTVRGWNLATGKRVWFGLENTTGANGEEGTVAHLDRAKGTPEDRGWTQFPGAVYFPSSGCYVFYSRWAQGG